MCNVQSAPRHTAASSATSGPSTASGFVYTVLATLALAAAATVSAQSAVQVFPSVLLHEVSSDAPVDATLTVTNPTDLTLRVRVYAADWHYLVDGSPNYLDAGSLPRSLGPFLTFTPAELLLEPGQRSEVRYSIELPPDADGGSYWGVLFLEAEDPDPVPGFALARFSVRVGHVVYANLAPLQPDGVIAGIFGDPPTGEGAEDAYTLAIQYLNTGNAVQRLDGYVELRDASGAVLFHDPLPAVVSLPGDMVGRTYKLFGPLDAGVYTALVVYNYGDESLDVASDYTFVLDEPLEEPAVQDAGAP